MVRQLDREKRERLLNAALKLFVSHGIQNASTAEIAREARIAAGTLFLYFPTKQALINELVLHISSQEADTINSLLDPSQSVRDAFFTIWDGSIRWLLDHLDAYQYSQQIRDSGLISDEVSQETAKLFYFYYATIQKGLLEGCIKPFPIELIGSFLYQDIVAEMNYLRVQTDASNQAASICQGFDIFWDGISVHRERENL